MGNKVGNAYGLTALLPIKHGVENDESYDKILRNALQGFALLETSPLAKVPNTYLSRVFILNDVFYEGKPAIEEHLANKYLVFSSNFHGDLKTYLTGMWDAIGDLLTDLLRHCVEFDSVSSAKDFVKYIKRCQVDNSLFFNGSNDQPLKEQLKALYLKQAFVHFAYQTQHLRFQGTEGDAQLQAAFQRFVELIDIDNQDQPSWPLAATEVPDFIESSVSDAVNASGVLS